MAEMPTGPYVSESDVPAAASERRSAVDGRARRIDTREVCRTEEHPAHTCRSVRLSGGFYDGAVALLRGLG